MRTNRTSGLISLILSRTQKACAPWRRGNKKVRLASIGAVFVALIVSFLIFQHPSNAASATVAPNGDASAAWSTGGTSNGDCTGHCGYIDENYTTPNTSNYVTTGTSTTASLTDKYNMSTFSLPSGTTTTNSVTVYIYDESTFVQSTPDTISVTLSDGTTSQPAQTVTPVLNSWGWQSVTFNVNYTQTQIDGMQVQIVRNLAGSGSASKQYDTLNVATMYASVNYTINSTFTQAAYRWYSNQDSTTPGAVLANQNTAATAPQQGTAFRLRMLMNIGTNGIPVNANTFKLQYAVRSGTCDTSFTGETYNDVTASTSDIRMYNNPTPVDGATITATGSDPTDSPNVVVPEAYDEGGPFTNPAAISAGQDGMWDFSLVDYGAASGTSYCFRIVNSDNSLLNSYTVIPEIKTASVDSGVQYLGDHKTTLALGKTSTAASGSNNFFLDFNKIPANNNETLTPNIELQNTSTAFTGTSNYSTPALSTFMNLPAIRYATCSAYDSTNHRIIYFGGLANTAGSYYNDAWALNLPKNGMASWTLLTANGASGSPSARRASECAYDSTQNRLILFGGYNGTTNYNDLWSLSLGSTPTWSQLTATGTAPAVRRAGRMTYDPVGNQMFLYAGTNGTTWYDDFYKLTLAGTPAWSSVSTTVTGQTRGDQGQVYDPVNRAIWVFGGTTATIDLNDVWKYNIASNTWTNPIATATACATASPATCPMPVDGAEVVYDSVNKDIVVAHGYNWGSNTGVAANQPTSTFILSNLATTPTWTRTDSASSTPMTTTLPSGRFNATADYDPLNQRMVIFAGEDNVDSEYIKDLEYLSLPTGNTGLGWGGLPSNTVMNGHDQMMPYFDPTTNYLYEFGGFGNGDLPTSNTTGGHSSETYRLDLSNTSRAARWKNVSPLNQTGVFNPIAREAAAYAQDTKRNRLIIFGGMNVETTLNDVWTMQMNGTGNPTWTQLCSPTSCGTAPPVRWLSTAIYDALNDRFIVFGGSGNSASGVNLNDVWALTNLSGSPTWQQLSPSGTAPAGRWGSAVAYDATNQRMIIFGGTADGGTTTDYNDLWSLSLGASPAWTKLTPTGTVPVGRARSTYALDTASGADKLVIFSGYSEANTTHYNDVDVLDMSTTNGAWSTPYANNCSDANAPSCRRSSSGVFDTTNNRLVTINGRDANGFFNSAYAFNLTSNTWTNLSPVNELGFSIPVTSLPDNAYHWQYWTVGSTTGASGMTSFGLNNDSPIAGTDFASCSPPTVTNRLRTGTSFCGLAQQNKFIGNPTQ